MKSAASVIVALAASALATHDEIPPNKRDVQTISNVIMMAETALQQLDTSVKAFNGQNVSGLASAAANVKSTLATGTTQIQATTPITAQDAITLQSSLAPVQSTAASLITDLSAKKPAIQQASLCEMVRQQTADISTSAQTLINTTVAKVPENLQAVAGQLSGQFVQQLSDASLSFAPGNCTDAAGGSGAGIALSNSSSTSSSAAPAASTTGKSAASTHAVSAFGLILAGAAGLMML